MPRAMSARAVASGAAVVEQADGRQRRGQYLLRAEDAEPFLPQHPDHRGEQPVVAGERPPGRGGRGCARPRRRGATPAGWAGAPGRSARGRDSPARAAPPGSRRRHRCAERCAARGRARRRRRDRPGRPGRPAAPRRRRRRPPAPAVPAAGEDAERTGHGGVRSDLFRQGRVGRQGGAAWHRSWFPCRRPAGSGSRRLFRRRCTGGKSPPGDRTP